MVEVDRGPGGLFGEPRAVRRPHQDREGRVSVADLVEEVLRCRVRQREDLVPEGWGGGGGGDAGTFGGGGEAGRWRAVG